MWSWCKKALWCTEQLEILDHGFHINERVDALLDIFMRKYFYLLPAT